MDKMLHADIVAILQAAPDLTIATIREDGYPQATTVSFVSDGLDIYFGCSRTSQKARNLAHNDRVSLTANLPYRSWNDIHGLSLAGRASPVTEGAAMERVGRVMREKYPSVADVLTVDPGEIALFKVTPEVISVLDYHKGFGHTDLVAVSAGDRVDAA